ncbi:MAG TPA: response regulator, partial [Spirochaetota bacterium]|nr:response regulator [Spirochaetota bacterium]
MNDIKILVIEDELIIAKSLEMYLNTLKYSCSTASKDIQALEILKTFTPDLILMDILLVGSKFDGIDLAREIKKT